MMKPTDVLVIGSGMSGLVAALAAAAKGKSVRVAARGAGALAISGGCVDVLGYVDGHTVHGHPLAAIPRLHPGHPYRIMGAPAVERALDFFTRACAAQGLDLLNAHGKNLWVPTILGTFKPSFLCPPASDREVLAAAETILVPRFPWLKDCHAGLAQRGLLAQKRLKHKNIVIPELSAPLGRTHRSLSPLDTARHLDRPEGEHWLLGQLAPHVNEHGPQGVAVLLPPILGVRSSTLLRARLAAALGCPLVEMAVPPPGVGGLRIRQALMKALAEAGVELVENARAAEARTQGKRCLSIVCDAPDKRRELEADSFIIATGGFLGGGLLASPGLAVEAIFDINLNAPRAVEDWSTPDVFQPQPYSRLGVRVNERLNPTDPSGETLWDNVFFAGRSLAGYDFVTEKSGNGVAIASGWFAAGQC